MTFYEVVRTLVRRWWVLLAALAATAALVHASGPSPPVYWAQYDLNLVAPDRSGTVFSRTAAPTGVTPLAGVLATMLDGNHPEPAAATQAVPLFGLRNRTGVQVLAKDKGLQWTRDYVAALAVQIVEPTDAEVNTQAAALDRRARAALAGAQAAQGVNREAWVTLESPSAIEVIEVYPARKRELIGAAALGLLGSVALTLLVDRWLTRRGRSRRPETPSRTPDHAGASG